MLCAALRCAVLSCAYGNPGRDEKQAKLPERLIFVAEALPGDAVNATRLRAALRKGDKATVRTMTTCEAAVEKIDKRSGNFDKVTPEFGGHVRLCEAAVERV